MKMLCPLLVAAVLVSNVWAGVSASVYLADEKTPLPLAEPNVPGVYREIMVGTRLTIFVSSNIGEYWVGRLLVPWEDRGTGGLSARGYNGDPNHPNYEGSSLEAAGEYPSVQHDLSTRGEGFQLGTDFNAVAGEWFVLDYRAEAVGTCNVELYEYHGTPDDPLSGILIEVLVDVLSFEHVPSCDFDGDTIVNFVDFALLASQWGPTVIGDPNMNGSPDIDADGIVDTIDLASFSEYWLERTDFNEPDTEPNILTTGL